MIQRQVAVIVLNWNGKADTLSCLASLEACKEGAIVVVDNGSTDGSVEAIRASFPHITLLQTGQNLGYAGGNNAGIEWALKEGFPYILILNNDTVVSPDLITQFLRGFEKQPDAGILGGKILLYSDPKILDHLGGMWNQEKGAFDFIGQRAPASEWQEMIPLDYVCGAAIMVKRTVFETVGLFDPRFFLFWEESDLCFRARKAGFGVYYCPEAELRHKVSASFVGGKPHTSYFFWRNKLLWLERNLPFKERIRPSLQTLMRAAALYKLTLLGQLQLKIARLRGKPTKEKEARIANYRACTCGVKDYLIRNFGAGSVERFLKK